MTRRIAYKVQWKFWADEWTDIAYFAEATEASWHITMLRWMWPAQSFRVVWYDLKQRRAA